MQIAGQAWANVCLLLLPSSSSLFRIYFGQNGTHFIWRTTLFLHWAWKYTEINLKVEFWSFSVMEEFELVWRREYKERGVNERKCKQQALIWAVWATPSEPILYFGQNRTHFNWRTTLFLLSMKIYRNIPKRRILAFESDGSVKSFGWENIGERYEWKNANSRSWVVHRN